MHGGMAFVFDSFIRRCFALIERKMSQHHSFGQWRGHFEVESICTVVKVRGRFTPSLFSVSVKYFTTASPTLTVSVASLRARCVTFGLFRSVTETDLEVQIADPLPDTKLRIA